MSISHLGRSSWSRPDPPPMEEVKFPPLPGNFQVKCAVQLQLLCFARAIGNIGFFTTQILGFYYPKIMKIMGSQSSCVVVFHFLNFPHLLMHSDILTSCLLDAKRKTCRACRMSARMPVRWESFRMTSLSLSLSLFVSLRFSSFLFLSLPFCSFLLVSLRFSCHLMSPVFSWRLSLLTPLVASLSRSNSSQNRMDDAVIQLRGSWKKHHRYQGHALDMVLVLSSYQVLHNLTTQNSTWSNWVSFICFY